MTCLGHRSLGRRSARAGGRHRHAAADGRGRPPASGRDRRPAAQSTFARRARCDLRSRQRWARSSALPKQLAPPRWWSAGRVDVFNPKCVRASAGALFFTRLPRVPDARVRRSESSAAGACDGSGRARPRRHRYDDVDLTGPSRSCSAARRTASAPTSQRRSTSWCRSRSRVGPSRSTWRPPPQSSASRLPGSGALRETGSSGRDRLLYFRSMIDEIREAAEQRACSPR